MSLRPIDGQLLKRVLAPYRAVARYVRSVDWIPPEGVTPPSARHPESWISLTAQCAVPRSWYITSTGHFNAVELNITCNQVMYTALAACASSGIHHVSPWHEDEFFQHQLPDVLIGDYRARFSRPIDPRGFICHFAICSVRTRGASGTVWMKTASRVTCPSGGSATVEATVALVRSLRTVDAANGPSVDTGHKFSPVTRLQPHASAR